MLAAESPIACTDVSNRHNRRRTCRKPLQPKNIPANNTNDLTKKTKPISNLGQIASILPIDYSNNKENNPSTFNSTQPTIELMDSSLAEELSAVRKKLERLRLDKEKTEKMLKDRDLILNLQMTEMIQRGEMQKELEIEVDRLYRLKQLRVACMRTSPIRSLREREIEKRNKGTQSEVIGPEESSFDRSTAKSPSLSAGSSMTASTSTSTSSMVTKTPILLRLSLESVSESSN